MEHNHLIHDFYLIILLILGILAYFRTTLIAFRRIQIFAVIALFIFASFHLNPAVLVFQDLHQGTENHQLNHPCCSVKIAEIPIFYSTPEPEKLVENYYQLAATRTLKIQTFTPNNKSPPLS